MLASFTAKAQSNMSAATATSKTSSRARLSGTASFRKCMMLQIISTARASSSGIRTSFGSLLLTFWPSANFGLNRLEKYVEALRRICEETRRRFESGPTSRYTSPFAAMAFQRQASASPVPLELRRERQDWCYESGVWWNECPRFSTLRSSVWVTPESAE
jgi:hypothetical protein